MFSIMLEFFRTEQPWPYSDFGPSSSHMARGKPIGIGHIIQEGQTELQRLFHRKFARPISRRRLNNTLEEAVAVGQLTAHEKEVLRVTAVK